MTVSNFACAMYHCDIIKDRVVVLRDEKIIYDDRMEFLRYASDHNPEMAWVNDFIQEVKIVAEENVREIEYCCDYYTEIRI